MNSDSDFSEKYMKMFNWNTNPFTFKIIPELFVGYMKEVERVFESLRNSEKFSLLIGPTGSGKTTMLKFLMSRLDGKHTFYLSKPPKRPEDWINIFTGFIGMSLFERLFLRKKNLNLYNLSEWVNKKVKKDNVILLIDEGHEASLETLEWLRTLTDQIENMYIVLSGLPKLEPTLKDNLETFTRRVNTKVELTNLTISETRELIKKRIEWCGGKDIKPFTSGSVNFIHEKTGGFPREIIRVCNELIQKSIEKNISTIDTNFLREVEIPERRIALGSVKRLPKRQRKLLEVLNNQGELTPSEIVSKIELKKYKDRENAIRSVNNILKRLLKEGIVMRTERGKSYKYKLSEKTKTLLVNA